MARTGTSRDGHAPENARTDPHGMGYVCRYTPTSRLVLRAAVTAEYLDGAFRRVTKAAALLGGWRLLALLGMRSACMRMRTRKATHSHGPSHHLLA